MQSKAISVNNRRMNSSLTVAPNRQLFDSTVSNIIDAIYITISVADIIFNSLICLLFYKDKSLRKPFNVLLLNLSLVDISSAFTIQPFIWIDFTKLRGNRAARFLCASSIGLVFFMSSCAANILTLSVITFFRYLSIVKNYQGRLITSNTIVKTLCIMTWIIGAATNIPNGLSFQYNEFEAICYRKWPDGVNGNLYSLLTTLLFGLFPTVLAIICYASLVLHIWRKSTEAPDRNIAAVRARKRVAILVGILLLALTICWCPLMSLWILGRAFRYFPNGLDGEYQMQRLQRLLAIFALLNSVIDPFIYIFSCPEYRKGIAKLIFALWRMNVPVSRRRVFTLGNYGEPEAETSRM